MSEVAEAPLSLLLDLTSPTPPFEQVRTQVAAYIAAGHLQPGDHLPTMRALAADLGIAVGTVARAYRDLEAQGLVASRRRTGTVVTGNTDRAAGPDGAAGTDGAPDSEGTPRTDGTADRRQDLRSAASAFVRQLDAGWSDEDVLVAVRGALLVIRSS